MRIVGKMDILVALYTIKDLAENNEIDELMFLDYGVCCALNLLGSDEGCKIVKSMCQDWEYFSGNALFPVGGLQEYKNTSNLWEGDHLKYRLSLLKHMIEKVETGYYTGEELS